MQVSLLRVMEMTTQVFSSVIKDVIKPARPGDAIRALT